MSGDVQAGDSPKASQSREEFLRVMREQAEIPRVEISDERRKIMRLVNPILSVASVAAFFTTVRRWRLRSKNQLQWNFEKNFNTEEKIKQNPKLYAYMLSAKCLETSVILVGTFTMALYYSICTYSGIYSIREFFIRTRIAMQDILPNFSTEVTEEQSKKEEELLMHIYDYLNNAENDQDVIKKRIDVASIFFGK